MVNENINSINKTLKGLFTNYDSGGTIQNCANTKAYPIETGTV